MQVECLSIYRDDILVSAELLKKCVALEGWIGSKSPQSREELERLRDTIDSSILQLNKQFLSSLSSEEAASTAVLLADSAAHQCESRAARANEGDLDLDDIVELYADPIAESLTADDENRSVLDFRTYARFVGTLLRLQNPDIPNPPAELVARWFAEHQREQIEFEDIEAVGDAEDRLICPISTRELEEPVRAPCGHVFSGEHIYQVLPVNGTIKCPSRGCSAKFDRKGLIRDYLMDIRVKVWRRKQALERQNETLGLLAI